MRLLVVLLAAAALFGAPVAAADPRELAVERVVIETQRGPQTFLLEVAADDASREYGLMNRRHLPPYAGMLFDFKAIVMTSFWMKATPLPLDILFVRKDGTISTIAANAVPFSEAPIRAAEPVRAVIEINGGLSQTLGIAAGDRVRASIFPRR